MKEKLKKVVAYIFRSWEDETSPPPHPRMKIISPFMLEVILYLIVLSILSRVGVYLWNLLIN